MVETQIKNQNIFWLWNKDIDFQKRGDVAYWIPPLSTAITLSHKLSEVAKLSDLKFSPSKNQNSEFSYIDISNVNASDGSYEKTIVKNANAPSRARKKLEKFDVIVSTVRPNRNATSIILEDVKNLVCTTGFAVLKAIKVNPYYLFTFTKTPHFIDQLVRQTSATMYPAVNENDVLNVGLFIPPEKDQQRVEQIIKDTFQLKEKAEKEYREAITLLEAMLGFSNKNQKTFIQWSDGIDFTKRLDVGYWQQSALKLNGKKLSEVASVNTGRQYFAYEKAENRVEFISIKDFENLYVGEADRFILRDDVVEKTRTTKDDVLLAVTGATIGKVGIFTRPQAVVSADVAIVRTKTISPYFLGALIQSKYGKSLIDKYTYGATNKHLDIKGFSENFIIPNVDKEITNKINNLLSNSSKRNEESKLKLQEAKDFVENLIVKK